MNLLQSYKIKMMRYWHKVDTKINGIECRVKQQPLTFILWVSKIMLPQNIHVLIPGSYEYCFIGNGN